LGSWHIKHSHSSGLQTIQRYRYSTQFPVRCCTRTNVLSLHLSYPGNGFITVSLWLQIKHEVFFSHPNSFLAISSQSTSTADSLNSLLQLPTPRLDSILIIVSQSHIATDGQTLCLGVEPRLWLMTRCYFLNES
jgi:hypothetical protein